MATKPADFFIGITDFFAIILPGAFLSYLALVALRQNGPGLIKLPSEGTAEGWVAFLLSSYLLGHFASLIGAAFLDRLYERTYVTLWTRTWRWGRSEPSPGYQRTYLTRLWTRSEDQLYEHAGTLKDKALGENNVSNYKWARMCLRLRNASAMQEIDRLEADSKFFRSVTVVLLIAAIEFAGAIMSHLGTGWGVSLWVIFVLLSFWRFSNLRWKAAEAAYLAIVSLEPNADIAAVTPA
jgi:hypothetical protein